jgi:dolichyl-phosphate-mannose--protein O-mannosyl transferase
MPPELEYALLPDAALYPVLMAFAFTLGGARLEIMRAVSLVVASGVLFTLFAIARRLGLGRLALLAPSLLALDGVFLRGSLVGRMDMLALGLVLLTLWLLTPAGNDGPPAEAGGSRAMARSRSFWAGLVAGLAMETHPIGMTAAVLLVGAVTAPALARLVRGSSDSKPSNDRLHSGWIAAGLLLGIVPWASM